MQNKKIDIAVIGGGAAGFFAAIHAAKTCNGRVAIFEKTRQWLSKVRISGGGRCNVTHACYKPGELVKYYPRGGKKLYKAYQQFATQDTWDWFQERGVKLKTEADGRIFPVSDNSETIIDTLLKEVKGLGVECYQQAAFAFINPVEEGFELHFKNQAPLKADQVILATGGHPKPAAYDWLKNLGLSVTDPFPSLFTFNVPDSGMTDLQGLSVQDGSVHLTGNKSQERGPVLITHWGFSGPAIIKLSAFAAETLYACNYHFHFLINWCGGYTEEEVRASIQAYAKQHPQKLVMRNPLFEIPGRLWKRQCEKAGIEHDRPYYELGKKMLNRLVEYLVKDPYEAKGKTTYKEEFVSAGGVDLKDMNLETFECKNIPGLYVTGELLNVDGVTGGFNFQHAWTSGYLAGKAAANKVKAHQPPA